MEKLVYTTNINCGGCVAKVKPYLDAVPGIGSWAVDTANPDKPLTIEGPKLDETAVLAAITSAGFAAKRAEKGWNKILKKFMT
jgi:copper chaperone